MRRRCRLNVDRLEDRSTPAVFGVPWADPRHLTVSFVPDGTQVGSQQSNLFATLDTSGPTSSWQHEILRALQSWSATANIDVGVVADNGAAIGTTAPEGNPPPFGDIRIAATPLATTALAIAVPPDPFYSDGWAGTVVLNSAAEYVPGQTDLYSVVLQEFGHALGLDNSPDPSSAMYEIADRPRTGPSDQDIVNLQHLYGVRLPDRYEGSTGNNILANATRIRPYESTNEPYTGAYPLVAYGDIAVRQDYDFFSVRVPASYTGPMTIRVRTAGLSMLAPGLTVYDQTGHVVGLVRSQALGGDVISVTVPNSVAGEMYYARVGTGSNLLFPQGRYAIATTFDGCNAVPSTRLDEVLLSPFETLSPAELRDMFLRPTVAQLNADRAGNETVASASVLTARAGIPSASDAVVNAWYETFGSIAAPTDVDVYRIVTPAAGQEIALTISVAATPPNGVIPSIELLDADQSPVPLTILGNDPARLRMQATGLNPNATYYVRLKSATPTQTGNYALSMLAGNVVAPLLGFASGVVNGVRVENLTVVQNQIYYFLLTNDGDTPLRMTLVDSSGNPLMNLVAPPHTTVNAAPILLRPDHYRMRLSTGTVPAAFALRLMVISDPIGPVLNDPTFNPFGGKYGNQPNGPVAVGLTPLEAFLEAVV